MAQEELSLPSVPANMDKALAEFQADRIAHDKAALARAYQEGGMYAAQDQLRAIEARDSGNGLAAAQDRVGVAVDIKVHETEQAVDGAANAVKKTAAGFWDSVVGFAEGVNNKVNQIDAAVDRVPGEITSGIKNGIADTLKGTADELKGLADNLTAKGVTHTANDDSHPVAPKAVPASAPGKSAGIEV